MAVKRIVANIATERVEDAKAFYADILGLNLVMDLGWILTFAGREAAAPQISIATEGATTFERAANIDPRQMQAITPPRALTSCTNLVTRGSSASKSGLFAPPGMSTPT